MNKRFERNIGALTEREQELLCGKRVFIAGCGGLGGYCAEYCVRIGVGNITLCDKDVFEISNLNRQLYANVYSLGRGKAAFTRERLLDINPEAKIAAVDFVLTDKNARAAVSGHDVVIDALDSVRDRLLLEKACADENIPLILGAVEGWCGHVSSVYPADRTAERLYKNKEESEPPSVLCFTAAAVGSFQIAEAVNVLLERPRLRNKLLIIDLLEQETKILDI